MQFSNGGAAFLAGKGIKNTGEKAAILGAIAGAQHVRLMAKHYGVPVILHSDHCAKVLFARCLLYTFTISFLYLIIY